MSSLRARIRTALRRRRRPEVVIVACDRGRGARLAPAFGWLGHTHVVDPTTAERLFEFLRPDLVVVELGVEGHGGDTAWHFRRALSTLAPGEPCVVAVSDLEPTAARNRAARVGAQAIVGFEDAGVLSRYVADQLRA